MEPLPADVLEKADGHDDREDAQSEAGDGTGAKRASGLRSFFKGGATMQDKLVDRLLQQVFPVDPETAAAATAQGANLVDDGGSNRPNFSLPTMSYNFRNFNARIGVVFKFQARAVRLLSWKQPSKTLSFLAVYTLVCLDPHLLVVLPPALLLIAVLIPSFVARHPEPPSIGAAPGTVVAGSGGGGYFSSGTRGATPEELAHNRSYYARGHVYSPRGPPVAPARVVKPVKELSRDFFSNMGNLQNSMADFVVAHDLVVSTIVPLTNFSDEGRSSALFVALFVACVAMSIAAHLLPWRGIMLVAGWAAVCSGNPKVVKRVAAFSDPAQAEKVGHPAALFDRWVADDIILDQAPETREVEIFELQRRSAAEADEWEAWAFIPGPYDPQSPARLAGDLPPGGTRYFEDVLAPDGWEWSEKKWALDLYSREWVEERIITGVEVETAGERWVYDLYDPNEGLTGVVENPSSSSRTSRAGYGGASQSTLSWEEGEEGVGQHGEWRRRRWVRLVRRKKVTTTG